MNTKTHTQFWTDVVKDLIGYEKGYLNTLRNVYTNPVDVFESYFDNRGKYVSPFTLLGVSFSIYYLISGFLVDWDLVAGSIKSLYRAFLEWTVSPSGAIDDVKKLRIERVYQEAIVPMTDILILGVSKYLIVIVLPVQIILLFCTSLFSKKLGFGFYHHFVAFNYFFSFSVLFLNLLIIVSLVNIWAALIFLIVYNYFFYGSFFRSYGDNRAPMKKAFVKGLALGAVLIIVLGTASSIISGVIRGQ